MFLSFSVDSTYKNLRINNCGIGIYAEFSQGTIFEEILCHFCGIGIKTQGGTLTNINTCYMSATKIGYDIVGIYTTINNCGADGTFNVPYRLRGSITINSSAFEDLRDQSVSYPGGNYAIWVHNQDRDGNQTVGGEKSSIVFNSFKNYYGSSKINAFFKIDYAMVTFNNCQFDTYNQKINIAADSSMSNIMEVGSSSHVIFSNSHFLVKSMLQAQPSCNLVISKDSTVTISSKGTNTVIQGAIHRRKFKRTLISKSPNTSATRFTLWNLTDFAVPANTTDNLPAISFYDKWKLQGNIQYTGFDTTGTNPPISGSFNVFLTKDSKVYETNSLSTDGYDSSCLVRVAIPLNYCLDFDIDLQITPININLADFSDPLEQPDIWP